MSEKRVRLDGDSAEAVAYMLLLGIAHAEGKTIVDGVAIADKKWLLNTYVDCLGTVRHATRTD